MLIVISPAKTLDFESIPQTAQYTQPAFLDEAETLIKRLRKLSAEDIQNLMRVNDKIAQLNYQRFQDWKRPFSPDNARQALFAFKGDVYQGIQAEGFHDEDLDYAQKHLRILSGLYGMLRPLDLMQPYRLEMGSKLDNEKGQDLYAFWKEKLTNSINHFIKQQNYHHLINLASNEYFNAIDNKKLNARIITPSFKENKNGKYKTIAIYAKKARGMMSNYIIKNKLNKVEDLKGFDYEGYLFNNDLSTSHEWVFTRY